MRSARWWAWAASLPGCLSKSSARITFSRRRTRASPARLTCTTDMTTNDLRQQPSGFTTFLWAIFFFFIFALVVVIWVRSAGPKEAYEDKRAAERLAIRQEVDKAAAEKLGTAAMVDAAKEVVRIPIADAKKVVLADLKAKKPA